MNQVDPAIVEAALDAYYETTREYGQLQSDHDRERIQKVVEIAVARTDKKWGKRMEILNKMMRKNVAAVESFLNDK